MQSTPPAWSPWITGLLGAGITLASIALPLAFPEWPPSAWKALVGIGVLLMIAAGVLAGKRLRPEYFSLSTYKPTIYFGKHIKRMPLLELRDLANKHGWNLFDDQSLHGLDLTKGLRQAGLDGELRFWGKPDIHVFSSLATEEPLNEIPAEHWKDFQIDTIGLLNTSDNFNVRTYRPGQTEKKGFLDLHVEATEARKWLRFRAENYQGSTKPNIK